MNSAAAAVVVGITAIVVTAAGLAMLVPLLRKNGVVDEPNHRSSHTVTTVRGAGLASALGVVGGWSIAGLAGHADGTLNVILAVGVLAAVLGLTEDLWGLTTKSRMVAQLGIGLGFGMAATLVTESPSWLIPVMAVGVAGYINAANFMDGVDSISAFHGIVAGAYFAALGGVTDRFSLVLAGIVLVAVFAGFAPQNLSRRRRAFLGDVGSYLLGGLIASCAGMSFLAGVGTVQAIAPTLPYVADTSWTMLQRARRREPLTQSHRSHVYQRLAIRGWSHVAIGTTVALASLLCGGIALMGRVGTVDSSISVLLVMGVMVAYLLLPQLVSRVSHRGTPS